MFISTHSLTRRLTKAVRGVYQVRKISTHSLTRRLTGERVNVNYVGTDFNSQPHKEADRTSRKY